MSEELWTLVDDYFDDGVVQPDGVLAASRDASDAAGLPTISVTASQGKLLYLLARMCGARSILEIGTLGGYSTIWMARALPDDGYMVTLEYDAKHAEVATANVARATEAGLKARVDIRVGAALETLPQLEQEDCGPFDFIFIDADKVNYPAYFEWAIRLGHQGTVIVADNVVRDGAVIDAESADTAVIAIRNMFASICADARVECTVIQTVGTKGYDGLAIARIVDDADN